LILWKKTHNLPAAELDEARVEDAQLRVGLADEAEAGPARVVVLGMGVVVVMVMVRGAGGALEPDVQAGPLVRELELVLGGWGGGRHGWCLPPACGVVWLIRWEDAFEWVRGGLGLVVTPKPSILELGSSAIAL